MLQQKAFKGTAARRPNAFSCAVKPRCPARSNLRVAAIHMTGSSSSQQLKLFSPSKVLTVLGDGPDHLRSDACSNTLTEGLLVLCGVSVYWVSPPPPIVQSTMPRMCCAMHAD